jgi:branched-chain amino acid transport system ATP-binding protein
MLEVQDLGVAYGAITAVHGVSLTVGQGELVTVLGANGAGKSSLLNAIAGVVRVRHGVVRLEGRDVTNWRAEQAAKSGVVLVPEGRRIFARLTVEENLRIGGYFLPEALIQERMAGMFRLFPVLAQRRRAYAGYLSGGEQQMLAIARALMSEPRLLLLDEPSAGLSPIATQIVYEALGNYISEHRATVLLVEQNMRMALRLATRGYVLELGSIKLAGSAAELIADDRVRQLYLGGRED